MDCSTPGFPSFTISWSLLKLMPIELVMLSNHLILCRHFSFCLQPFPASGFFPVSQLLHQMAMSGLGYCGPKLCLNLFPLLL